MLCWFMLPFHKQCIFVCYDHIGVGIQHAGNDTMTTPGIPDKEQERMYMIDHTVRECLRVVVNFNISFSCSFCAPSMTLGSFLEHNQQTPSSLSRGGCVCLESSVDKRG